MKKLIYSIFLLAAMAFTVSGCEDVPSPFDSPTEPADTDTTQNVVVKPAGTGTLADPYNVAAVEALYSGTLPTTDIYVKGIVSTINDIDTGTYGNATYFISDDGKTDNQYEIYHGYYLDGAKFTSTDQLKVGDTLVVKGTPVLYGSTKEFGKGSSIISINGKGSSVDPGTPSGEGTVASPYNVAKALEIIKAGTYTSDNVYISGTICETPMFYSNYGTFTYYISDDGGTTKLQVYGGLSFDGAKFTGETDLKSGDEVVVCGALTIYKSTPEVASKSTLYSLNGKTSSTGGGETGTTPTVSGSTVTLGSKTTEDKSVTIDLSTLKGEDGSTLADGTAAPTVTLSDGSTVVFAKGGNTIAPMFYTKTKGVRVYSNSTVTINGKSNISGVVFTCDTYKNVEQVGNADATYVIDGKSLVYTNGTATSGGTQLRVQTITIYYK